MVECEHLSVSVLLKTADVYKVEPQLWACAGNDLDHRFSMRKLATPK